MKVVVGDIILILLASLLMVPAAISDSEFLTVLNMEGARLGSMEILEDQGAKYVQLLSVTKFFNGSVKSDPLLKRMTVTIMDNDIVINIDRSYLSVNDEEYVISNPPVNMSGKIAVPLEFLTEILPKATGKRTILDREKWILRVDIESKDVIVDEEEVQEEDVYGKEEVVEPKIGTFRLILDPGHGGTDTGVKGQANVLEKDLTLLVAQNMKNVLNQEGNLDVYITRKADDYMPLEDRTSFANRLQGDIFLSIHFNWSFSSDTNGFRIYVNSDQVRMETESELGGVLSKFRGERSEKLKYLSQSQQFAREIANRLGNVGLAGKYDSEAPLLVMDRLSMPGVLVEIAYLSNSEDMKFLSSEDSIDRISQELCDSVLAFISEYGDKTQTPVISGKEN